MDTNLQELQGQQSEDIARAWVQGRMLRLPVSADRYRVVILEAGKVVDDFFSTFDEQGGTDNRTTPATMSFMGERPTEKTLKNAGWMKGKDVAFNKITRDLEIQVRSRNTDGDGDGDESENSL